MWASPRFNRLSCIGVAVLLNLVYLPLTSANWRYKSRPDLSPPTLNITIRATPEDEPLPHGPLQPAPYIFTSTGELVWSGFGYVSGWAANFQAAKYKGEDVVFVFEGSRNTNWGHSHGHVKILNGKYETVKEARGGNVKVLDLHEFQIVDGKTALVGCYSPVPYELKRNGAGPRSQWIVDAVFQEIDIETGRVLFEWSSLDHVQPDESIKPIPFLFFGTGHNSSDVLDYFHLNSIDIDAQHNYLISARHTSTIYKINSTTGSIIWRLGGKYSNFTLSPGIQFGMQHHVRIIFQEGDTEIISLFSNSGSELKPGTGEYLKKSTGKIISLNTHTWTATLIQEYLAPDEIFAFSQGSTQILPNSNVFINWGSGGAITEFSPKGEVIFHAYLESGDLWKNGQVQNYRSFRFNWTGVPVEEPVVTALRHGESIMVYVSWNGDTETRVWRFWGVDGEGNEGNEVLLGEEERVGFETGFYVHSGGSWRGFLAEAVGRDGKVLRRSVVVGLKEYVYPYVPGRDDLLLGDGNGVQSAQRVLDDEQVIL